MDEENREIVSRREHSKIKTFMDWGRPQNYLSLKLLSRLTYIHKLYSYFLWDENKEMVFKIYHN